MNGISDAEFIEGAFIQEGVSPVAGIIIAACTIGDDYDNPKNRVGVRKQDVWLEFGLSAEAILSVDAAIDGSAYVLGENGSVVRFDWKSPTTREALKASRKAYANAAVGNIGPLRRIRILGDDVICAGSVGQVYCLLGDRFETLPKLSVGSQEVTIEDIAGSSRSDIVAVTSDGYAAHFDGTNWTVLDLPTNASLTSICRLDNGHCAMAGKNGTVLIGVADQWSIVQPIDMRRSYWGIAAHNDEIYAAHLAGVDKVAGQTLIALDIEEADLQFTVLRSSTEGVWSFADRTIGLIRDDQWQTIMK
ncbi:hypothetical protein [Pseudomonas fluorescens]|uniref:Uncharacterized protein n=1 Tax=Pseudomonas fluorescens TaxID=294 RepID=A0A944HFR5_PSEFL|nr:hypothetical protein [Pseudomonas fluorescens]MBT2298443.1 hypothetical protein [Pseudomonas fluorescens]MBT2309969.1 hypothetical protein [Pseudomonas fluorescens]MBT2310992.1 hypothetical protein [Pseudomonas fluorescens]MBT2320073.1 hypothetical protein [Pseudomonas fluorescens]MBT2328899.1 hypothetical protein [Pseudomonas fluorescens]